MDDTTWLSTEDYRKTVQAMPVVSVDLIVSDETERVLLGKRKNRPAAGSWFVPGGRLLKGEDIANAVRRISAQELNEEMRHAEVLGVCHQRYPDNFADDSFDSHYVTFFVSVPVRSWLCLCPDDQHEEFRWWSVQDLLEAEDVHEVTKNYFRGTRSKNMILS